MQVEDEGRCWCWDAGEGEGGRVDGRRDGVCLSVCLLGREGLWLLCCWLGALC